MKGIGIRWLKNPNILGKIIVTTTNTNLGDESLG
jgi:hypothetical protein